MNINWNQFQLQPSFLTSYTLIDNDTNDFSIFVYDNEPLNPISVQHFKGLDLKLELDLEDSVLASSLQSIAFIHLSIFISNFMDHYSEVYTSLILPNFLTANTILNTLFLDNDIIYTTNINLQTFAEFSALGYNFWNSSSFETFFHEVTELNMFYQELNGNISNKSILAKASLLKYEATKTGFYVNHPSLDITKNIK